MMGKARSFRLTKENEVRFASLKEMLRLDNENRVFNHIIEHYHEYESKKRLLNALGIVAEEIVK